MTFEEEALAALGLEPQVMHAKPVLVHSIVRETGRKAAIPARFLRGRKVATLKAKRRADLDRREKAVARAIAGVVGRWQTRFLAACKARHLLERGSVDLHTPIDAMPESALFVHRLREVGPYKKPNPPPNRLPPPPDSSVPPGFAAAANAAFVAQELEDPLIEAIELELLTGQNAAADDAALDGVGAELRWDVVPENAIAGYRKYAADFADSVVGDDKDALMSVVENALKVGTSPKALANDITAFFGEGVHRVANDGTLFTHATGDWAMLVARTELARAYIGGARDLYTSAGYTKWLWLAAHDERQCEYCDEADGTVLPIGETFPGVDVEQPPAHPNCFPAGTRVAADSEAATVRRYDGELVTIVLESGHELAATANHPIATRFGWVAIGELREGDDVLCGARSEREMAPVYPYDDDVEPAIEQVAEAFTMVAPSMPTAPKDFHGDGAGSEVHVIRADGLLRRHRTSTLSQHSDKRDFGRALVAAGGLHPQRAALEFFGRRFPTASSVISRERIEAALLWSTTRNVELVGFPNPADDDFRLYQKPFDPRATDAERLCERLLGFPGEVTTSKVRAVKVELFHGDVYSLSTAQGWHTANGIIAHNCLCTMVADPDAIDKLGGTEPGDDDASDDADDDD